MIEFLISLPTMILLAAGGFNLSQYFIIEQRSQILARQTASGVFRECVPLPASMTTLFGCTRNAMNNFQTYNSILLGSDSTVPTNVTLSVYKFDTPSGTITRENLKCDGALAANGECRTYFNLSNISQRVSALNADHPQAIVMEHFHDYEFPGFFGQVFGKREVYAATVF